MRPMWSATLAGGMTLLGGLAAGGQEAGSVAPPLVAPASSVRAPLVAPRYRAQPLTAPGDGVVPASGSTVMPVPPQPQPNLPAAGVTTAPAVGTAPSAATSYFHPTPPPPPPTRMGRARQRLRSLLGTDRDENGDRPEVIPYDPSTGRSHIPAFSRPWLKPPGS